VTERAVVSGSNWGRGFWSRWGFARVWAAKWVPDSRACSTVGK
jgi:hypothetical protein